MVTLMDPEQCYAFRTFPHLAQYRSPMAYPKHMAQIGTAVSIESRHHKGTALSLMALCRKASC